MLSFSSYNQVSGVSGYSGASTSGYSGASGESGYSGSSGVSGAGVSGFSGVSGYSGATGLSGYSGSGGGSLNEFKVTAPASGMAVSIESGVVRKDNVVYSVSGQNLTLTDGGSGDLADVLLHFDGNITDTGTASLTFTAQSSGAYPSTAQSKFGGWSERFDNTTSGWIRTPMAPAIYWTSDFTIDCWVNTTDATTDGGFYRGVWTIGNSNGDGLELGIFNTGVMILYSANGSVYITGTVAVNDGNWHHLACVRSGTSVKMYVDGVLDGTPSTSSFAFSGGYLFIGVAGDATIPGGKWNGYVDEFRIVKGTAVWTSGFTPNSSPYSPSSGAVTNYVELGESGIASFNTSGFTPGRIPLATAYGGGSGYLTPVVDKRTWVVLDSPSGYSGYSGISGATGNSGVSGYSGSAGTGLTWNEITGTSGTASVNNGYITNNAGLVTVWLPATAPLGSVVRVAGKGAGGWKIAQNSNNQIHLGNTASTSGTSGYLASTNQYDAIELLNITADDIWTTTSVVGNIGVN